MDFPQLLGGYYTAFSTQAEIQSAINLWLERIESGDGRSQYAMYKTPGLRTSRYTNALDPSKKTARGFLELNDFLFAVQDNVIYLLNPDGTRSATVGPIQDDHMIVSMAASKNSFFTVSLNVLYRWFSGALTMPLLPFTPSAVATIGGYVVCTEEGSNQFFFSRDDGATWAALDAQFAEAAPNNLLNLVTDHQELWLLGNRLIQVYVVGSDPDAPFVPIQSAVIEMGLGAKRAFARMDNSLFIYGKNKDGDRMFYRMNGYIPQRISTHAVENTWRAYTRDDDASAQTFQLNGHNCIRLTFPSANNGLGETWNYDASLPAPLAWTKVAWWNMIESRFERHRGNTYVSAFGKILVGDHSNGNIYEMNPDIYTDFNYPIKWLRRTPHSVAGRKNVQYKRLDLFMEMGVGSVAPLWLNDHSWDAAFFATQIAAAVFAGTITIGQAQVMTLIYNYLPYADPSLLVMPSDEIMTQFHFFDYARNPQMEMRYSNNSGKSYTNPRQRSLGRVGQTKKQLFWGPGLGMGRDRVFEFSGLSPSKIAFTGAEFDAVLCDK